MNYGKARGVPLEKVYLPKEVLTGLKPDREGTTIPGCTVAEGIYYSRRINYQLQPVGLTVKEHLDILYNLPRNREGITARLKHHGAHLSMSFSNKKQEIEVLGVRGIHKSPSDNMLYLDFVVDYNLEGERVLGQNIPLPLSMFNGTVARVLGELYPHGAVEIPMSYIRICPVCESKGLHIGADILGSDVHYSLRCYSCNFGRTLREDFNLHGYPIDPVYFLKGRRIQKSIVKDSVPLTYERLAFNSQALDDNLNPYWGTETSKTAARNNKADAEIAKLIIYGGEQS